MAHDKAFRHRAKVRFYIEARTEQGKKSVFETAERMTKEALGMG